MRKTMVLLGTAAALLLAGCGGGFSCDDKGSCPNDTQTLGSAINNCQALRDGSCGSEFDDYVGCLESNETCGASGDGVIDSSKCNTEQALWVDCCKHNPAACPVD